MKLPKKTTDWLKALDSVDGILPVPDFNPHTPPAVFKGLPRDAYDYFRTPFDPSVPGAEEKARIMGWRLNSKGRAIAAEVRG